MYVQKKPNGDWVVYDSYSRNPPVSMMEYMAGLMRRVNELGPGDHIGCPFCGTSTNAAGFKGHPCRYPVMEWRKEQETRRESKSMANVVICDPCGTVTAQRVAGEAVYTPNPEEPHKTYTLCPDCSEKIYDVLHPDSRNTPILRGFDPSQRPRPVTVPAETTRAALEAEYGEGSEYRTAPATRGEQRTA